MDSFLMIKPDAHNRGIATKVRQDVLAMCQQQNLVVLGEYTKVLTTQEVLTIYPNIRQKSFHIEFLALMVSNRSNLILLSGDDAIRKTKAIRGRHRKNENDQGSGIRGKYCYMDNACVEEVAKLAIDSPERKRLIATRIEAILHAPDTIEEVAIVYEIFCKKTNGS